MTETPDSIWVDSEVLAVRVATVALLTALLLFAAALAFSLLLVEVSLSALLAPLGWGVTLLALVGGLALSTLVFRELLPLVRDLVRVALRLASTVSFAKPITTTTTIRRLVAYGVFGTLALASYVGLHGWAHRAALAGDHTGRVVVPSSPATTLLLVTLDAAAATAGLAMLGFVAAAIARVYSLAAARFPLANRAKRRRRTAHVRAWFPAAPRPATESDDNVDRNVLTDFTGRLAVAATALGLVALGIGQLLRRVGPSAGWPVVRSIRTALTGTVAEPLVKSRIGAAFLALSLALVATVALRIVGQLVARLGRTAIATTGPTRSSPRHQAPLAERYPDVLFARTRGPSLRVLAGAFWLGGGCAVYLLALNALPTSRAAAPPVPLLAPATPPSFTALAQTLLAPPTYAELARVLSVTAVLAAAVPWSLAAREWWLAVSGTTFIARARTALGQTTRPLEIFTARMTTVDGASNWTLWVQAGVLVQLFGLAGLFQAAAGAGAFHQAVGVVAIGMMITAGFAALDLRARTDAVHTRTRLWPVAILLFPLVGGIGYVLWAY